MGESCVLSGTGWEAAFAAEAGGARCTHRCSQRHKPSMDQALLCPGWCSDAAANCLFSSVAGLAPGVPA